MNTRGSGVLLHITSLPSRFGIGDMGPGAFDFIHFLSETGQRYWQILPIHPTDTGSDNSPYHSLSAFAGNSLLISPELMVVDGYLEESDLMPVPSFPSDTVDYLRVTEYKESLFTLAFNRFLTKTPDRSYVQFCQEQAWWLDNYAIFCALKQKFAPACWGDWPREYWSRNKDQPGLLNHEEMNHTRREKFIQYLFFMQWRMLRKKCHESGIFLIGDIPMYVDYDSADVWSHPDLFQLDEDCKPLVVSGVPPDYFSETGQIWNNPVYNWDMMKEKKFDWWVSRMEHLLSLVDYVRIDHFRGLVAFWEIPAGSDTAMNGRWVEAPGFDLLQILSKRFVYLPVIAEDLGIITPDVREIMNQFSLPGMKVLLFAFGEGMPKNPYIPHNIPRECIVYTGTHDNNPVLGWYSSEASEEEKHYLSVYVGKEILPGETSWLLIRMAMLSVGNTAIIQMQDLLGLGSEARMNTPGTDSGNWRWRLPDTGIDTDVRDRFYNLTYLSART